MVLDLRAAMFDRLLRLPTRFFDDQTSGSLLSKVAYDVKQRERCGDVRPDRAGARLDRGVGLLGWLFYLNWKLTLITLAIAPPIALTVRLIAARLRQHGARRAAPIGDLVHVLQETIECHKVVKVFGGDAYEAKRFQKTAQNLRGFLMRERDGRGAHHPDHARARGDSGRRDHLHRHAGRSWRPARRSASSPRS